MKSENKSNLDLLIVKTQEALSNPVYGTYREVHLGNLSLQCSMLNAKE